MSRFMDRDFLLGNKTARTLFFEHSEKLPIIDYHCHIPPRDIARDRSFENLTQLWLGGDHYKWRLMRAAGVGEEYITGGAPDKEKFLRWAAVLGRAVGNPLYHWSHLELQRYFGYDRCLNSDTAEEVWELTSERLSDGDMTAKALIKRSNVEVICTTDDPVDSLKHHAEIRNSGFGTRVLPAWRPDRAMNADKPGYAGYIGKLEQASGIGCGSLDGLKRALASRMDHFAANGCVIADHGFDHIMHSPADRAAVESIYAKALSGETVSRDEGDILRTELMRFMGAEYVRRGWVMQLHYGCLRNVNPVMMERIGADSGYDCISNYTPAEKLTGFLGMLEAENALPKTILYSLNPADNAVVSCAAGCFQNGSAVSRIQHGAAWWFNDHLGGIRDQLSSLASLGYLAGFVGMLTDSRSLLSYTRHEYFRRILCGLLGEWTEAGLFPDDMDTLGAITEDISYRNARRYFGF